MVAVTVCLVVSMIFLFTSMVLSSMAAAENVKDNVALAHKYSTWSAVVCGLSIVLIAAALIVYYNSGRIRSSLKLQ